MRGRCIKLGAAVALVTILCDQLQKWAMLELLHIAERPPIEITGFFRLVMVWNRGVSFGMFSGHDELTRWFLIAVALAISAGMIVWLWRCHDRFIAAAIGLIIGGALGNVIDRLRFGAVADFFDFYLGDYHWPAFNVADSAIFIGVALLLWDGLFRKKPDHTAGDS